VSRRASLPGADELFRRTSPAETKAESRKAAPAQAAPKVNKSTKPQIASVTEVPSKAPKHDEKITFYCTAEDLVALEQARLALRSQHGVAADRGKIVRAAVAYVLEDFEARAEDSILLRRLSE
jgi:hypothetical protein